MSNAVIEDSGAGSSPSSPRAARGRQPAEAATRRRRSAADGTWRPLNTQRGTADRCGGPTGSLIGPAKMLEALDVVWGGLPTPRWQVYPDELLLLKSLAERGDEGGLA